MASQLQLRSMIMVTHSIVSFTKLGSSKTNAMLRHSNTAYTKKVDSYYNEW